MTFCICERCVTEKLIQEIESKKELLESARTYMRINKELARELDRLEVRK